MATGEPRYGVDPYLEWVNREGIPVVEDIGIDLFEVPVKPWDRFGCDGAAVHLRGRGDFSSMFLCCLEQTRHGLFLRRWIPWK